MFKRRLITVLLTFILVLNMSSVVFAGPGGGPGPPCSCCFVPFSLPINIDCDCDDDCNCNDDNCDNGNTYGIALPAEWSLNL